MRNAPLSALVPVLLALALGCGGPRATSQVDGVTPLRGGVKEVGGGRLRVVGMASTDARAALDDAMARAGVYARSRGERLLPDSIEPGKGLDAFGRPVYTCALTFRSEPDPRIADPSAQSHSDSTLEHRLRLLVDEGVLTIEEYSQLMGIPQAPGSSLQSGSTVSPGSSLQSGSTVSPGSSLQSGSTEANTPR